MIVYRLRKQVRADGQETVEFFATQSEVIQEFRRAVESGMRALAEKMECPTDKHGLPEALNRAGMHPDHWIAKEVVRSHWGGTNG